MLKFYPLLLVESYLLLTILLFLFGPIIFDYHNKFLFILLLISYHISFIIGYFVATWGELKANAVSFESFSSHKFWILFILGIIGLIGSYNNIMLSVSIIPVDFFENLIRGINDPGLIYTERMMKIEDGIDSGSRIFNILSIFFAYAKLLFIFYFLFYWCQINLPYKVVSLLYSFLFVSIGVSAGLNSIVFIFVIFSLSSIAVILTVKKSKYLIIFLFASIFAMIIPILSFGNIMLQRGGGFYYFITTSPLSDISLKTDFELNGSSNVFDFIYYSIVWLSYYVTQGYYSFSLIINLDWSWTYGFGNSDFLQRQFFLITGYDISTLTYQHKINHFWDKTAQWHSFYGQFANDFGINGLIVLMFALGYHFSKICQSAFIFKSFYAASLIPIYVIMFIFFPANNQVFSNIDMISYFIIINILWILEGKNKI